jgi:hypothetical protein
VLPAETTNVISLAFVGYPIALVHNNFENKISSSVIKQQATVVTEPAIFPSKQSTASMSKPRLITTVIDPVNNITIQVLMLALHQHQPASRWRCEQFHFQFQHFSLSQFPPFMIYGWVILSLNLADTG